MNNGFCENVSVDEGVDPATGIRTILHFEGDSLIVQKQWDATPYLEHVRAMRDRNEGKGWGEGKEVGYIPPAFHAQIVTIQDRKERAKAVKQFFRDNPAFCAYDAYLKR